MGTMYNETNVKKRTPVVIQVLIMLTAAIVISDILETVRVGRLMVEKISDPLLILFMTGFIFYEVLECRTSYKYSIIANQLIIHKITQKNYEVVECIYLDDILYVGNPLGCLGKYKIKEIKNYSCSIKLFNSQCCVYKSSNGNKKLYFKPSKRLENKIMILKK